MREETFVICNEYFDGLNKKVSFFLGIVINNLNNIQGNYKYAKVILYEEVQLLKYFLLMHWPYYKNYTFIK